MSIKKLQSVDLEKIQSLYDSGISVAKIAKIFKVGQTTMFRYFDKNNIKTRTRNEAYELKHLTEDQEKEVWNLYYNSGLNREGIAEKLNISIYSVRSVINGNCLPGKEKFKLNFEKNTDPLTYEQEQLILGSLLGDAGLSCRDRYGCKDQLEFYIVHGEPQLEYIKYAANILNINNIGKSIQGENSFGAGNNLYRLSYFNKYELIKIHNISSENNRKTITKEWMKKIDPLALSYWFMDDGSSHYSFKNNAVNAMFHTQSFNEIEHKILMDKLLEFNIETILRKNITSGTGLSIYIRQKSINKFMDLIEPYVNNIPCMKYKIKRKN